MVLAFVLPHVALDVYECTDCWRARERSRMYVCSQGLNACEHACTRGQCRTWRAARAEAYFALVRTDSGYCHDTRGGCPGDMRSAQGSPCHATSPQSRRCRSGLCVSTRSGHEPSCLVRQGALLSAALLAFFWTLSCARDRCGGVRGQPLSLRTAAWAGGRSVGLSVTL